MVAISSLSQLIKSWKTKKTKDIAMLWLIINLVGQTLWITYGFFKDSPSLIVMSPITLLILGSVLVLKVRFG